jgi:hypothetical protein
VNLLETLKLKAPNPETEGGVPSGLNHPNRQCATTGWIASIRLVKAALPQS